jgi:hypothetical protein
MDAGILANTTLNRNLQWNLQIEFVDALLTMVRGVLLCTPMDVLDLF